MLSLVKAGTAKWLKSGIERAVKIVIVKEMVKPLRKTKAQNTGSRKKARESNVHSRN